MPIDIVPTPPFPDAQAVVIDYLLAVETLTDLIGERIGSDKDPTPGSPTMRITRPGAFAAVPRRLDKPTIQVDVWADSDVLAFQIAAIAYAALFDMPALLDDARAIVTEVVEQVGIREFPDTQTDQPRVEFEVGVFLHARSGS